LHAAHAIGLLSLFGPAHELRHQRIAARAVGGHREPVGDTARRLDQPGGLEIGLRDHHARGKVDEAGAAVGFEHDRALDREAHIAEQQRIADLQLQRFEQSAIDPGRACAR
jgi:hypothetical protein